MYQYNIMCMETFCYFEVQYDMIDIMYTGTDPEINQGGVTITYAVYAYLQPLDLLNFHFDLWLQAFLSFDF